MSSSSTRHFWILGITGLAAAMPVFFGLIKLGDSAFRDDFLSNLAATIIGLVVGIPVALELSRRQQAAEEASASEKRDREEGSRKQKVLQLLRRELDNNRKALTARVSQADAPGQRVVLLPPLKNELWNAFSDGGELEWIQDPELVDKLAEAYYEIAGIIYLEGQYFEAAHFAGMRVAQPQPPEKRIIEYLTRADKNVTNAIDSAIDAIDKSLT